MKHRVCFLSIVAMCFLGAAWCGGTAYGQQASSQAGGQSTGMTASPNGNQQQQNANQNQKQEEESKPAAPRYLTFTKEANPGLTAGKAGKSYSLVVSPSPAGGDVSIDGYFLGRSPVTVQLPAGTYLVRVNKWGYEEWVQELVVSSGSSLSLNPHLKPAW